MQKPMINTLSTDKKTARKKPQNTTALSLSDLLENADKETLEVIVENLQGYVAHFFSNKDTQERINDHLKTLGWTSHKVLETDDISLSASMDTQRWEAHVSNPLAEFRFFIRKPSKDEYHDILMRKWHENRDTTSLPPDARKVKVPEDYYEYIDINFKEKDSDQEVLATFERDRRSPEKYTIEATYHKKNLGGGSLSTSEVLEKLWILIAKMEGRPLP